MNRFLSHTVADLHSGRETWRVMLAVGTPAFVIAVAFALFNRF